MGLLLPASWHLIAASCPRYHPVRFILSRHTWLPFADIPGTFSLSDLYDDLKQSFPEGFVIRGCHPAISDLFVSKQHDTFRTGIDAVLVLSDRSHFEGRKVQASLKRGWRHGAVEEVLPDAVHAERYRDLLAASPHVRKPQLRHLFRTHPLHASRCFVFSSFTGNWLACLTLSRRGERAYHTELMLRRKEAPGDIMECLITETASRLRQEGAAELSLGEVPFLLHAHDHQPLNLLEQLFFAVAPVFSHVYDYESLYAFKNKFCPVWRTMRFCAGPGVKFSPTFLSELAWSMGLVELLGFGGESSAVR